MALLNWLLYQLQKAIWEIYDGLRWTLVLGGYFFPEPRDLNKVPWSLMYLNASFAHMFSGTRASFNDYPRVQEDHQLLGTTEHHLLYPNTAQEKEHAEPAPQPFHAALPESFISGNHPYDPHIEKLYDCTGPYGSGDQYTHYVDSKTWRGTQFGSALAFSARLISHRLDDLPDFNLDGDRGYGWKCWRAVNPQTINTNMVDVHYINQ